MADDFDESLDRLLDMWRDGKYVEVSTILTSSDQKLLIVFCSKLVRFFGVNQIYFLEKLMN